MTPEFLSAIVQILSNGGALAVFVWWNNRITKGELRTKQEYDGWKEQRDAISNAHQDLVNHLQSQIKDRDARISAMQGDFERREIDFNATRERLMSIALKGIETAERSSSVAERSSVVADKAVEQVKQRRGT